MTDERTSMEQVSDPRTESLRYQIQSWLMEEGWHVRAEDPKGQAWLLTAVDEQQRRIGVAQVAQPADRIVIQATLTVSNEDSYILAKDNETLDDVLWTIRFGLLTLGVEFGGIERPPKRITVMQRIYPDGLSKDKFLQRVTQVRNGLLMVQWKFGQLVESLQKGTASKEVGFRKEEQA